MSAQLFTLIVRFEPLIFLKIVTVEKEWCSTFYKGLLAFDYHEMSLDKLLRELKASQVPTEIVNILFLNYSGLMKVKRGKCWVIL